MLCFKEKTIDPLLIQRHTTLKIYINKNSHKKLSFAHRNLFVNGVYILNNFI